MKNHIIVILAYLLSITPGCKTVGSHTKETHVTPVTGPALILEKSNELRKQVLRNLGHEDPVSFLHYDREKRRLFETDMNEVLERQSENKKYLPYIGKLEDHYVMTMDTRALNNGKILLLMQRYKVAKWPNTSIVVLQKKDGITLDLPNAAKKQEFEAKMQQHVQTLKGFISRTSQLNEQQSQYDKLALPILQNIERNKSQNDAIAETAQIVLMFAMAGFLLVSAGLFMSALDIGVKGIASSTPVRAPLSGLVIVLMGFAAVFAMIIGLSFVVDTNLRNKMQKDLDQLKKLKEQIFGEGKEYSPQP